MWNLVHDTKVSITQWQQTEINRLDPEEVRSTHKKYLATANRLKATFADMKGTKAPESVARIKQKELSDFTNKIPIIRCLCTEGLKKNHIEEMSKVLRLDPKIDCTQQNILYLPDDAPQQIQKLDEIADFASKQFSNENQLKNMVKDWEPLRFDTKEWKGVSHILDGEAVEVLSTTLDDHIIRTQTMRGSPYIEPFKEELFAWED